MCAARNILFIVESLFKTSWGEKGCRNKKFSWETELNKAICIKGKVLLKQELLKVDYP